ncbi:AGE family epimerase/isomerase [Nocardioides sp. C4-1]|uniref:AGE family epimerase/isomerase n=1 Tax=Nocardioides sp. C4-1 TaxID=3151851 RepID=UPI0032649D74
MRPGPTRPVRALLAVAAGSAVDLGFAWLDDDGVPVPARGLQLWINARMTYVFSVALLLGDREHEALAAHGVQALRGALADHEHEGWLHEVALDGAVVDGTKSCYDHAFVVLAASAATAAGVAGGPGLLDDALEVHLTRFWDDDAGLARESFSREWGVGESYRGANSNMHTVEAYLAAADVTGEPAWLDRAVRIVERLVHDVARRHDWRVVEHFDEHWTPLPDHHADRVDDPFRPYGATPGHGFEWARLAVQLAAALADPPPWLLECAVGLYDRAVVDTDGGTTGFAYTTDWSGRPVVTERFHWVVAEAVLAASALHAATGDRRYADDEGRWRALAEDHFVDHARGSWAHELDEHLRPSSRTWSGRPDAYHAFNAQVLPTLPSWPASSLR